MTLSPVRRIVTGHNREGRAIIAMDGAPPSVFPLKAVAGVVFHEIWNTDASPAPIDSGADPTARPLQLHPTPRGSVIRVVDIPPDAARTDVSRADAHAAFREIGAATASTGSGSAPHPFMHRTETVDYGIVVAGDLWLVVDEGEVKLAPGDIVVQRGTNHAWSNRGDTTARMIFVLLDGVFTEPSR
jgi:naringenin degradation protein FdeH